MKNLLSAFTVCSIFLVNSSLSLSRERIAPGDPPNNINIPAFYRSRLSDIDAELDSLRNGSFQIIATSPGGLPVFAVFYGEKDDFHSQANYHSAVAAQNPKYYAHKDQESKPVVLILGPVHGQESENIAGIVNLMHVIETGKDYRGKAWPEIKRKVEQCRTIIIPCGNPDGRRRCPYDSFIDIPTNIMTKYGQGTHLDGSLWGWPQAKSRHPMVGDVGILGAYFNDAGINVMQDDFFRPMAGETAAILNMARVEAPDITVSLHSHEYEPMILQPAYVAMFMKQRVHDLAYRLNSRYQKNGLPFVPEKILWRPSVDDPELPPSITFNLLGALHHVSGTMPFTFECCHGSTSENPRAPKVDFDQILDIELMLFDEMYSYILEHRLVWE